MHPAIIIGTVRSLRTLLYGISRSTERISIVLIKICAEKFVIVKSYRTFVKACEKANYVQLQLLLNCISASYICRIQQI